MIAGQAWHWVDPVLGEKRRPTGFDRGSHRRLLERLRVPGGLRPSLLRRRPGRGTGVPVLPERHARCRGVICAFGDNAADDNRQTEAFDEPEQWQFEWARPYTKAEWLDTVPTFGGHTRIPPEKLAGLLTGIGNVIDEAGGSFTMGYTAVAVTAERCLVGLNGPLANARIFTGLTENTSTSWPAGWTK